MARFAPPELALTRAESHELNMKLAREYRKWAHQSRSTWMYDFWIAEAVRCEDKARKD